MATAGKNLSKALLSTCSHRKWTSNHEQILRNYLSGSSPSHRPLLTPSLLSSTIDPHLLSHHHLALGLFHWATQQPSFFHTPQTYHCILKSLSLSSTSSPSTIQALVQQAEKNRIPLPVASYEMAVSALVSSGKPIEASHMLFSRLPILNSDVFCKKTRNSLLAALSINGHWRYTHKLFDQISKRNLGFDDVGFGVFISTYVRTTDLDKTFDLIDGLSSTDSSQVTGSIIAFLVVDGLCRVGRHEEAWHSLEELRIRGFKPDFISYRVVAEAFNSGRRQEEVSLILKQKRKFGVAPRTKEYKDFILALLANKHAKTANELATAIVTGDFPIDGEVLDRLISSTSIVDPESAMSLCQTTLQKNIGYTPCFATVNDLCRNLCRSGRNDEIRMLYNCLMSTNKYEDVDSYKLMVFYLCKTGSIREAYDVIKEMRKKGFNPEVDSYNLLMEACCVQDLIRPAKKIWDEMFRNNICGNLHTYNILIHKFQELDHIDEALSLFEHMVSKKISPDFATYSAVTKVLCRADRVDSACNMLKKSREQDLKLFSSVLNYLVLYLCKQGIVFNIHIIRI